MSYSPILLLHISGGVAGLFSGAAALFFRKGSQRHRVAGDIFVVSMIIMAVGAVYVSFLKHDKGNIIGGFMTFYFVTTAWLTARRRDGGTSIFGWVAFAFALAFAAFMLNSGFKVVASGATKAKDGVPVGMIFFLGSIGVLSAAGDLRMLVRGVTETQRLVRHLWRMCFALFIASGSFFLGPANRPLRFVKGLGLKQHVFAVLLNGNTRLTLAVLPLILMIFWMIRVRLTNRYIRKKVAVNAVNKVKGSEVLDVIGTPERTAAGLSAIAK